MVPSADFKFTFVTLRYSTHINCLVPSYYVKPMLPKNCIRRERRHQWLQRVYEAEEALIPRGTHIVMDWYIRSADASLFKKDGEFFSNMLLFLGYEKNYWAFSNSTSFVEGICPPVSHCTNCINGFIRVLSAIKGEYDYKPCKDECSGHDENPPSDMFELLEPEAER